MIPTVGLGFVGVLLIVLGVIDAAETGTGSRWLDAMDGESIGAPHER